MEVEEIKEEGRRIEEEVGGEREGNNEKMKEENE